MTLEVILHLTKDLVLHNDSIRRKFEQNQLINEYARENLVKIP